MFVKVGKELFNTAHVVRACFNNHTLALTLHEGGNDGSIGFNRYFDGAEAEALWAYLTSTSLCIDVLAVRNGHPSVKHPFVQSLEDACKTPVRP